MTDELTPTAESQALVEQLGDHDWRVAMAAGQALSQTGQAGTEAVLWASPIRTHACGGDALAF